MKSRFPWCFLAFVLLLTATHGVLAQTTGLISGTVRDSSGGVLQGAVMQVTNTDTGWERTSATSESGWYTFIGLPVGVYRISASFPGFQTTLRSGIDLTVGREAIVNFVLQVSPREDTIEIAGEAPLLNTTDAAATHLVDRVQVHDLPLNGRDLVQLATLQMGVVAAPAGESRRVLSIGGARPNQNSFLLDGADINDEKQRAPGSASETLLGVETIREFEVLSNNYSAEFGRSPGGIINAVTRSGGNRLEGSLYAFHRNDNLDARNFFDGDAKPEFKRNQFGFLVGGPIKRNRTFFLASYEGLRQGLGLTRLATVPNALAREGKVPISGRLTDVGLEPAVEPYLALFPLPNTGRDFGDGTGEFSSSTTQVTDENYFLFRLDNHMSESNDFFVRYVFSDGLRTSPDELGLVADFDDSRNQYLTMGENWVVSPHLLNTFRFSFNRSRIDQDSLWLGNIPPELSFVPGKALGAIGITGISDLGPSRWRPSGAALNLFELHDGVAYTAGSHSIKFGCDMKRLQYNAEATQYALGYYSFRSLKDFLTASPTSTRLPFPDLDSHRGWRQWMWGFYAQDDIRWKTNFTWNLGLRYEFITVPREVNGKVANLRDPIHDTQTTEGDPLFKNPSLKNFAPRVGFSWDPFGNGKTSVRAGFGVFFDQIWTYGYKLPGAYQPPFYRLASISRPVFPNQFELLDFEATGLDPSLVTIEFAPNNPYTLHYNLHLQYEFPQQTVLTVGYVGSRGINLFRFLDINIAVPQILPDGRKFFAEGVSQRNPAFGTINYRPSDGNSFYNSLQVGIRRRFSEGLSFQSSYTFSKSIDEGSITYSSGTGEFDNGMKPQDPDDRLSERALSSFDIRHNWVLNFVYDIPFGRGLSHTVDRLLADWQVNGIISLASGNPFSALLGFNQAPTSPGAWETSQRPNLVLGRSNNPVLGGPDCYFDPSAFELQEPGYFGNLGRNTLIGPGLASIDLVLVKSVPFRNENQRLQIRIEAFNLFNRPNFAFPESTVFARGGVRVGSAGRITATRTPSRQVQFGLKFFF